jgi:uncharacterized protein YhfF
VIDKNSDTIRRFWRRFCETSGLADENTPYQAWYFSNNQESAIRLAQLVLAGRKTATASLKSINELRPEVAPIVDTFSIVTDFHGQPICVIKTIAVREVPFNEVELQFALDEGEGDETIEEWQQGHNEYFTREAAEAGIHFDERSIVCCEHFKVVYAE